MQCHLTDFVLYSSSRSARELICCTDDSIQCVQNPKQMIAWHQNSTVNVFPPQGVSPGYNGGMDWKAGAQSDIFGMASSSPTSSISVPTTTTSTVKGVVRGQAIATTSLGKEDGLLYHIANFGEPAITIIHQVNGIGVGSMDCE
jgi:hypothetical protein